MGFRKFLIQYGPKGIETKEVPYIETAMQPKAKSPKLKPMPKKKPFSPIGENGNTSPKPKAHQPGPDRTYQVAVRAIKEGIKDRQLIEKMIHEIYIGAGKTPEYIAKSINRAWSMINDKSFRAKIT